MRPFEVQCIQARPPEGRLVREAVEFRNVLAKQTCVFARRKLLINHASVDVTANRKLITRP